MTNVDPNLRKAAVLLRSLDADTAAVMLGRLSTEEAATIRAAMRAVGQVESDEQADVAAELRGTRPTKQFSSSAGDVELAFSTTYANEPYERVAKAGTIESDIASSKRFEFLENAPIHALVPHLAREHAQTIAVVLSHLPPERAAAILAALPQNIRTETVDRLSTLGDTDPECVSVLVRELEAWLAHRDGSRANNAHRRDTMAAILAAADAQSRGQILSSMRDHKAALAGQFSSPYSERALKKPQPTEPPVKKTTARVTAIPVRAPLAPPIPKVERRLPRIAFDDLAALDSRTLSAVLRQVDANLLVLALAGSREELVDRICDQMPKRTAREFRRELRRLGPTRLSDVEAAQHAVAQIAAEQLAESQPAFATSRA